MTDFLDAYKCTNKACKTKELNLCECKRQDGLTLCMPQCYVTGQKRPSKVL